jgi:hypothetical protein
MSTMTKSQTLLRAFTIDETAIRRLFELVRQENNTKPYITIICSDESSIKTDEINTLLEFPNTKVRHIRGIVFHSAYHSPLRVLIDICDDPTIRYEVVGQDKDVAFLSAQVTEILSSCLVWYSWLYEFYSFPLWFINFVFSVIFARTGLNYVEQIWQVNGLERGLLLAGMLTLMFWTNWRVVVKSIFPAATFSVGRMVAKSNPLKVILRFIGFILLSLLLGFAANWLYAQWSTQDHLRSGLP